MLSMSERLGKKSIITSTRKPSVQGGSVRLNSTEQFRSDKITDSLVNSPRLDFRSVSSNHFFFNGGIRYKSRRIYDRYPLSANKCFQTNCCSLSWYVPSIHFKNILYPDSNTKDPARYSPSQHQNPPSPKPKNLLKLGGKCSSNLHGYGTFNQEQHPYSHLSSVAKPISQRTNSCLRFVREAFQCLN